MLGMNCKKKGRINLYRDIRKNASGVEEVEKELKEEKIEAISGGLGTLRFADGRTIGELIKENVKAQTELTDQ